MTIENTYIRRKECDNINKNKFINIKLGETESFINKHPIIVGVLVASFSIVISVSMIFLFWCKISKFIKSLH